MEGPVYNTPMNTMGIGDPVPFGPGHFGSGDRFDGFCKPHRGVNKHGGMQPFHKPAPPQSFGGFQPMPLIVMSTDNPTTRKKKKTTKKKK